MPPLVLVSDHRRGLTSVVAGAEQCTIGIRCLSFDEEARYGRLLRDVIQTETGYNVI